MAKGKKYNIIYKCAAILLSVITLISTVVTGTLAWYDFTQNKANIFRGTVEKTTVILNKYEKDDEGNIITHPVPNAQFKLFREMDDGSAVQVGEVYTTDNTGKIKIEKLNTGSYYFEETQPGYGYTYDMDGEGNEIKRYPFSVTAADTQDEAVIEVEAYNRRLRGELEITKTVAGTGADTAQQFEFTVTFSDDGDYKYKVDGAGEEKSLVNGKLYLKHGEKAVFESLPAGISYTVTEAPVSGYTLQSENSQGSIKPGERITAGFINSYDKTGEKGQLEISKTVSGLNVDTTKEFEFRVTFGVAGTYVYRINGGGTRLLQNGGTILLSHNDTAVFSDLPIGLSYTVTETSAGAEGYVASVSNMSGIIISSTVKAQFDNHKDEYDKLPGALVIKKTVYGEGANLNKKFAFTVKFSDSGSYPYSINGVSKGYLSSGERIELRHNETAVFTDIPAGVTYTVTERDYSADNYISGTKEQRGAIPSGSNAYVSFYNYYEKDEDSTVKLTVTKKIEGVIPEKDKDKEFWFTFKLDGEELRFALKAGGSKSFTIPVGSSYSVTEDDYFKDNYIQSSVVNGSGTARDEDIKITVTNTYVGTILTSISGTKTWDAPEGVKLPESITLYLKNNGVTVGTKTVKSDNDGKWTYTFTAPKYDNNGKEITYTIEEVPVPGFTGKVNGYDIKNTYTGPGSISVSVTKKWVGENPDQPGSVNVQLYRNGVVYGSPVTLNAKNGWTYTWTGLEDTASWTVDESTVPDGYTKTVEKNNAGEFIIYNTFKDTPVPQPDEEYLTINGVKTWEHGENPESNRPDSITVYVKDGSNVVSSQVVSEQTHWQWSFVLPKYRADGVTEIQYTIDEAEVKGYVKTIDGFNIKNTHMSYEPPITSDESVVISGTKTWDHGSNSADKQPESITIMVKIGDYVVAQKLVTAADNWKWSIDLPKYDSEGNIVNYSISEANVPNYTAAYDGFNIKNTFKSDTYPGDSPKTGDTSDIWFWLGTMIISMLSLVGLLLFSKYGEKYRKIIVKALKRQ